MASRLVAAVALMALAYQKGQVPDARFIRTHGWFVTSRTGNPQRFWQIHSAGERRFQKARDGKLYCSFI
mgnify:CR=1 FL=1